MISQQLNTSHFYLSIIDTKRAITPRYRRDFNKLLLAFGPVIGICDHFIFGERGPMALRKRGVETVELTLELCGKRKIKGLNRAYRDRVKVTDVLSFPIHEDLRKTPGKRLPLPQGLEIGNLFICKEKALQQADEFSITYIQEIIHLFVHGFLHLLGYDHEKSAKEDDLMVSYEDKLVQAIYNKLNQKGNETR